MAKSYDLYPALTGAVTDFALNFEYLDKTHVKATVEGASVPFTFLSTYLVRLAVAPVGELKVYRETPTDELINEYTDGSVLVDDQLNRSFLQSVFVAEEVADNAMRQNDDGSWNVAGLRLADLGTPTLPSDAVTKEYADEQAVAALASQTTTEAAKDLAVVSSTAAGISAAAALSAKEQAEAAVKAAENHADTAEMFAVSADVNLKAPIESPSFTGTPEAPTATSGDSSLHLANTAFVAAAVGARIVISDTEPLNLDENAIWIEV